jgi:hypothetical protein
MMPPLSLSAGPRRCTSCGSREVQRSRRRNPLEWLILPLLLLRPFRCNLCDDRHYGFFFRKRAVSVSRTAPEASAYHQTSKEPVS